MYEAEIFLSYCVLMKDHKDFSQTPRIKYANPNMICVTSCLNAALMHKNALHVSMTVFFSDATSCQFENFETQGQL